MGVKSKERECLDKVINSKNVVGDFATGIHRFLVANKENIVDSESPDFIIETDSEVIGIEHCLADVLFGVKHNDTQSLVRTQEGRATKKINDYKEHPDKFEKDLENGQAMGFVEGMVKERFDRREKFEYPKFISNFKRVCLDHNSKCDEYRNNVTEKLGKITRLACIIEIPYPNTNVYLLTDTLHREHEQALQALPFTYDMLNIIEKMNGFDFVVVCMYCFDSSGRKKGTKVYIFNTKKVQFCIKQQNIKPFVRFDYPNKYGVSINSKRVDGGYKITASPK
ncbi:MAG: hypothetical protein NC299_14255 [Lachnospiraceae bacterium]|nr:hypothetical protein [Ruminococcus sp.]MCM1276500.1 hypothetical protein [Lachnospiraceae bacterium]